ncbi:Uma2 family endonuclease [Gammaproteobacteria bacterium]
MPQAQRRLLSEAEYLAFEQQSSSRHEYLAGEIYAMTGGTLRHNRIIGNLHLALSLILRGKPCQIFFTDVKLRIAATKAYYYPDILVTCSSDRLNLADDAQSVDAPILLVEVLSPTTETVDRREKLAAYRQIPSLQEYVLVRQDVPRVEVFRRQGDIGWIVMNHGPGDTLEWTSVGLSLPIANLYEGCEIRV